MDFTKWSISTKRENFAISREEISVKNQKIYDSKKALLLLNFSNRSNFAEKLPSTTMTTKRPQNSIQEKYLAHGLRTSCEEIAFTARPKIQSQSQIFRHGQSIFCLPHRPKFSDIFDLCLHWVSVVRGFNEYRLMSKLY